MNTKPSAGTVARLICLVLSTLNQVVLMKTGRSFLPVESEELEEALSTIFFCGVRRLGLLEEQLVDQRGHCNG